MKTVISIVLIISISLLTVMLPMQIGSITTDVSADSSMFIGTFSTAFLAWLIAMLAGLGITIGSLADFNEILSTPAGTSFMNDAYTLWNQQSDLFKVGSYMGAYKFIQFRNLVKSWINSEDTQDIINSTPQEYLGYQIENGIIKYRGCNLIPVTKLTNIATYSFGGYTLPTSSYSHDKTQVHDQSLVIFNQYADRSYESIGGFYKQQYNNIQANGYYPSCTIVDADNVYVKTLFSRTYEDFGSDNAGWIYFAKPFMDGFLPDSNGNIFNVYAKAINVSSGEIRSNGLTVWGAFSADIFVETVNVNGYVKPVIKWDAGKIAHDLTNDDVAVNDTVSVSIPTTLREQLTDAFTNQAISINDVAMPQVEDVPITSTNQYITNNIITNVSEVAIPDLDFDFPELDSFRLPTGITTKFPFSIPFDVGRAFGMMVAPAQAPVFVLPFTIQRLNIHHDITLDLTEWESVAEVVRWFLLAIFILILVVVTRKLIKG